MSQELLCLCYTEISLKNGKVTLCPSLHNSDFADTFLGKSLIFRQAEQELREVVTAAYTQPRAGRKLCPAGRLCFSRSVTLIQVLKVVGWPWLT